MNNEFPTLENLGKPEMSGQKKSRNLNNSNQVIFYQKNVIVGMIMSLISRQQNRFFMSVERTNKEGFLNCPWEFRKEVKEKKKRNKSM